MTGDFSFLKELASMRRGAALEVKTILKAMGQPSHWQRQDYNPLKVTRGGARGPGVFEIQGNTDGSICQVMCTDTLKPAEGQKTLSIHLFNFIFPFFTGQS